jgi:Holliday junction resolvase YEN1
MHAVFVFDGRHRPRVKRGKTRGQGGFRDMPSYKRLIRACGFQTWQAPGEAEAECAYLQQRGIVDAVLSDDVDTLAFGAMHVFKNWGALNYLGSKTDAHGKKLSGQTAATHTKLFTQARILERKRMTRAGCVLVALMSGGDYDTDGIKGCGPHIAVQAAIAGFGEELVQALRSDMLDSWRVRLREELTTNKSGFFSGKHAAIAAQLHGDFPDTIIADQYLNPTVTTAEAMREKAALIDWHQQPDLEALRALGTEYLDMVDRDGDLKFIRTLALPCFMLTMVSPNSPAATFEIINKPRRHASTDEMDELRVKFVPRHMVPIVVQEREDLDAFEGQPVAAAAEMDLTASKLHWIPRYLLERAYAGKVREWEQALLAPKSPKKRVPASPKKRRVDRQDSAHSFHSRQPSIEEYLPIVKKWSSFAQLTDDDQTDDDLPDDLAQTFRARYCSSQSMQRQLVPATPPSKRTQATAKIATSPLKQSRIAYPSMKKLDAIVILSSPEATPEKRRIMRDTIIDLT